MTDEERDAELVSLVEADQRQQVEDIMLEVYAEGIAPCICRLCEYVQYGDPSSRELTCSNCEAPASVSVAVLAGMI